MKFLGDVGAFLLFNVLVGRGEAGAQSACAKTISRQAREAFGAFDGGRERLRTQSETALPSGSVLRG